MSVLHFFFYMTSKDPQTVFLFQWRKILRLSFFGRWAYSDHKLKPIQKQVLSLSKLHRKAIQKVFDTNDTNRAASLHYLETIFVKEINKIRIFCLNTRLFNYNSDMFSNNCKKKIIHCIKAKQKNNKQYLRRWRRYYIKRNTIAKPAFY